MNHLTRTLVFAASLTLVTPALAQYATTTALPPCSADTSGNTLIVQRPPTDAELTAALPQKLLVMNDHISCDGSVWNLTTTAPQYRGGSQ
jgi:hypothetical protein